MTETVNAIGLNHNVVRMGGFHLPMSAIGSLGYLMNGSGLEEALQEVYGSTTVQHMMTGKAIAHALGGL